MARGLSWERLRRVTSRTSSKKLKVMSCLYNFFHQPNGTNALRLRAPGGSLQLRWRLSDGPPFLCLADEFLARLQRAEVRRDGRAIGRGDN
jgi:hypothetical protein